MPPPEWLKEYWKQEKNWLKRYMNGSWELNMILSGHKSEVDLTTTLWKPKAIRDFLEYMDKNKQLLKKEIKLYRGTEFISPTMDPACYQIKSKQFLSTTKSLNIAKEFAGKNGYVHTLICSKGVPTYDYKDIYEDDNIKREKEVLIYPGVVLTLIKKLNNNLVWNVTFTYDQSTK